MFVTVSSVFTYGLDGHVPRKMAPSRPGRIREKMVQFIVMTMRCFMKPVLYLMNLKSPKPIPPIKDKLLLHSATQLAELIRTRQITSEEVVRAYIQRIIEVNPLLNAVVDQRFEDALGDARYMDHIVQDRVKTREELEKDFPLLGVPFTVKESLGVRGLSYGCGQLREVGVVADEDAETVRLLKEAGAIPLLVSNTPELCMHLESANRVTGRTNNPYDTRRTPGGSSGGEAALVSSAASVFGIGSDLAGSLRLPASFTGIFSHKPTPGVVPIAGHKPTTSDKTFAKLLCIGPLVRYAEDLPLLLRILAHENAWCLRLDIPVNMSTLTVYYMEDDGGSGSTSAVKPQIKNAVRNVAEHLAGKYNITAQAVNIEGLKNILLQLVLGMFTMDGIEEIVMKNSKYKAMKGTCLEVLKYCTAMSDLSFPLVLYLVIRRFLEKLSEQDRRKIKENNDNLKKTFQDLLGENAVFLYPTFVQTALLQREMYSMCLNVTYTLVFNVLELPATSCPVGFDNHGLPIGIQVVAGPCQDRLTIAVAKEIETAFGGWTPPWLSASNT